MIRLILTDEFFYGLIIPKCDILHRMGCDKSVLTYHNRKMHTLSFRDPVSLKEIIVHFLIGLGVYLYPSGIPCSHRIGVFRIYVKRTGKASVNKCHHNRESA